VGQYPDTIILKSSKLRTIILNLISGLFTAGCLWLFLTGMREWFLIFFPLCSLVFLWMLFKPASVTLNVNNITFSNMGRNVSHNWNEISNLGSRSVGKLGSRTHFMTADKQVKGKMKNIMLGQFDVKMKREAFLTLVLAYREAALRNR